MGNTGAGRSHVRPSSFIPSHISAKVFLQFINAAAGFELAPVCDSQTSKNLAVQHFKVQRPETPQEHVIFVEPPGFDHGNESMDDANILRAISEWMNKSLVSSLLLRVRVFTDLSYINQYTDARGTHNLEVLYTCMISAKIG